MASGNPRREWLKALVAKHADGDLQAFAEKVRIDRSTVSLLYNGHRAVTDKYAIRISNRLAVDPPPDMKLQPVASGSEPSKAPTTEEARVLKALEEQGKAISELQALVMRLTNVVLKLTEDR